MTAQNSLPIVQEEEGSLVPVPQAILDRRIRKNKEEVLVHWQGLSSTDATWEHLGDLRLRYSHDTLEDKGISLSIHFGWFAKVQGTSGVRGSIQVLST